MSNTPIDDDPFADTASAKRGRPPLAKKPEDAPTPRYKMKAKPNWTDLDPATMDDSPDRLRIDPAIIPEGMTFQWVSDSIYGQPIPQHRAKFEKTGWTPVHQEDFDGVFDGLFMSKGSPGEIKVDGMVLMARPTELTRRAKTLEKQRANEVIRIKEQALRGGDLNTSLDSQHPSALRTNRITRSMERIEIPEDR